MGVKKHFEPSNEPTTRLFVRRLGSLSVGNILHLAAIDPGSVFPSLSEKGNALFLTFSSTEEAIRGKELLEALPLRPTLEVSFLGGRIEKPSTVPEPAYLPSNAPFLPPGIIYIPNFITMDEEQNIVRNLDNSKWSEQLQRRVQHFGIVFDYHNKTVGDVAKDPFPSWTCDLVDRIEHYVEETHACRIKLDQLTCNEYKPGIGISSHCDTHTPFGDFIPVVSLLEPIAFDMSPDPTLNGYPARVSLWIEPRSLFIMSGEARYGWKHAIAKRLSDTDPQGHRIARTRRISLTFREVVRGVTACTCTYPSLCDSRVQVQLPTRIREA